MTGAHYSREGESEATRLDRNYSELLQELRVAQTGVQILFAFLLGIAFQNRFTKISSYERGTYVVTLIAAACAAIFLISPVAVHRMLFRRHQKGELVELTSRLAATGLLFLGVSILSAVFFVLDVVVGLTVAIICTAVLAILLVGLWYFLPSEVRRRRPSRELSTDPAERTFAPESRRKRVTIEDIVELYDDTERCAATAGLRYVSPGEPGIRRLRRGKGFSYIDAQGKPVAAEVRLRLQALAIPPAWSDVWICASEDGHLLAVGYDERGRRQYLYHPQWRAFRDLLNFYRLVDVGPRLPRVRADVATQLRRRTFDRDQVLAAMLRIVDARGLRVGSEEYAEENAHYGLSTLAKRHVRVSGGTVLFDFPAKSGKQAHVALPDRAVARIVARLLPAPGHRMFTVDGSPITADELNQRLSDLAGARITAKDFRTWHGTRVAFSSLRAHLPPPEDEGVREKRVINAVDAAADFLRNTRTVARSHYVHPHVVAAYLDGSFSELLALRRAPRTPGLDSDERALLGFLGTLFAQHLHGF